jgi:hypothetical protein
MYISWVLVAIIVMTQQMRPPQGTDYNGFVLWVT